MTDFEPAYNETYHNGLFTDKIRKTYESLSSCELCPRKCNVDRLSGQKGICKTGEKAVVSSFNPHFGEEEPLVGNNGSGTIFLLTVICYATFARIMISAISVKEKRSPTNNWRVSCCIYKTQGATTLIS